MNKIFILYKMKEYFLLLFFLQIINISSKLKSDFTYEIIDELDYKFIAFEIKDFSSFKIFKYILKCVEMINTSLKNVYLQISNSDFLLLYVYDDFLKIQQNENAAFINYIKRIDLMYKVPNSVPIVNLDCGKDYYFIISEDMNTPSFNYTSFFQFVIIDADIGTINIPNYRSNYFSILPRENHNKEIIYYSNDETKYGLFNIGDRAKVQIFKNDKIIYNKTIEEKPIKNTIELEKNQNYTIIFDNSENKKYEAFTIHLFNEPEIFKPNFENGPLILNNNKYIFEIDISNYSLDNIILFVCYSKSVYYFKYQFGNEFNGNNFINLGYHSYQNFIPIKKTKETSSLFIYFENFYDHDYEFYILNLIPNNIVEQIHSEYNDKIQGPKYFYIDYFDLNGMNSIGFGADENFIFYEQKREVDNFIFKKDYTNTFITKMNNYAPETFKNAIIYFNSTNEILFQIKKYNYPIFYNDFYFNNLVPNEEFFQLCQGENTLNELYFYITVNSFNENEDLFKPVFGSLDVYYIKEEEIKTLSDFNFDIIEDNNFYYTFRNNGYLKIKCTTPLMLKHSFLLFDHKTKEFNSGQKYYLDDNDIKLFNFTFNRTLIDKELNIKFTIYGLKQNEKINLILDNKIYPLSNIPFELTFKYKEYSPNLFYFEVGDEIENLLITEIIVGSLPEEINKIFKQIDFVDSLGSLVIEKEKGVIIKIPEYFNEDLYDFSILFLGDNKTISYKNLFYCDISYDKLEYQTINKNYFNEQTSPIVPLFRVNPYEQITENSLNDENKYFYILIYNYYRQMKIYIKKPMLYTDIKLNNITALPQLNEKDKYYCQIKLPEIEEDYNSLIVQVTKSGFPIKLSLSKNYIQYPILYYEDYFKIPYNNRDKNQIFYLNYYYADSYLGYINLVGTNEYVNPYFSREFYFHEKVQQIEKTNKINIQMNSLSYLLYPTIFKYFLIINIKDMTMDDFYSIITGQRSINSSNYEFMEIVEDEGLNKTFETNIEINIDLIEDNLAGNIMYIVPVKEKTNIIDFEYSTEEIFKYKNKNDDEDEEDKRGDDDGNKNESNENSNSNKINKKTIFIIVLIILGTLIIIIIGVLCYLRYKKRHNINNIVENNTEKNSENNALYENISNNE